MGDGRQHAGDGALSIRLSGAWMPPHRVQPWARDCHPRRHRAALRSSGAVSVKWWKIS